MPRPLLSPLVPLLVLVAVFAAAGARAQTTPAGIAVVVATSSAIDSIDIDSLRELYLRRRTLLGGGTRAVPINLPAGHPARSAFSMQVLGRSPAELAPYWDRLYYDGIRPPIVLPSSDAIRRYLQAESRAVGYMPRGDVDASVRVLLVLPLH